jgi:hypothetical protein
VLLRQLAWVSKDDLRLPVVVADWPCHADTRLLVGRVFAGGHYAAYGGGFADVARGVLGGQGRCDGREETQTTNTAVKTSNPAGLIGPRA